MPNTKKPSSFAWFMVHVTFPLVPFLIEGGIRIVTFDNLISWNTFSSSTLAMSSGLLCLFVSQSLLTHKRSLPSKEETEQIIGVAHMFSGLAIICFVFFGVIVLLTALIEKLNHTGVESVKLAFDIIILIGATVPIILSILVQRSFKLRTSL